MRECHLPPRPQDLYTATSETVRPVVLLGDPLTGAGGDSSRTAFSKFNEHEHLLAGPTSFRSAAVAVGDLIQVFDLQGQACLPPSTEVIAVLGERLELSKPAGTTSRRAIALVQSRHGSTTIPNIVLTQNQTYLTREERSGFIEGRWLEQLAAETLSATWFRPPAGLHNLCLRLPYNASLKEVLLQASAGQVNVTLQIDQNATLVPELTARQTLTAWSATDLVYIRQGSRIHLKLDQLSSDLGQFSVSLTLIKHLS